LLLDYPWKYCLLLPVFAETQFDTPCCRRGFCLISEVEELGLFRDGLSS
jgi:hypothetical protein